MSTLVINKKDLLENIERIKELVEKNGKDDKGNSLKIIAVVKANGYGLGIVEFTKILISKGIKVVPAIIKAKKAAPNSILDSEIIATCSCLLTFNSFIK